MTITLTSATRIAGAEQAAGTQHALDPALEADLVRRKLATYVAPPALGGADPVRIVQMTAAQLATYTGRTGEVVEVTDLPGRPQYRWDGARFVPVAPRANRKLVEGGSGATSGWVPAAPYAERFALELLVATGGAAASLTLDGSNDGVNSAAQIATASLDTLNVQTLTPPIRAVYPYIRWTIVGAGSGSVRISSGV